MDDSQIWYRFAKNSAQTDGLFFISKFSGFASQHTERGGGNTAWQQSYPPGRLLCWAPGLHLLPQYSSCLVFYLTWCFISSSCSSPLTLKRVCVHTGMCLKSQISESVSLWFLWSSLVWKGRRGSDLAASLCPCAASATSPVKRQVIRIIRGKELLCYWKSPGCSGAAVYLCVFSQAAAGSCSVQQLLTHSQEAAFHLLNCPIFTSEMEWAELLTMGRVCARVLSFSLSCRWKRMPHTAHTTAFKQVNFLCGGDSNETINQ